MEWNLFFLFVEPIFVAGFFSLDEKPEKSIKIANEIILNDQKTTFLISGW